ncbi:MAG: hypothetical protein ACTH2Q_16205 [Propionibacteriaceae bacterium]
MTDLTPPVRERHFDAICRAFVIAAALVTLSLVAGIIATRAVGFEIPLWVWGVALLTSVIVAVAFVVTGRYEVVVDEAGVRRIGVGGSTVPWSSITEVVELPTRQRHLAVVGGPPPTRVWGECGLAKPHGLPRGTIVFQVGAEARVAITDHTGQSPRVLPRP